MDVISIDFEKGLLTCLFGNQVWISLIEHGELLQYVGRKDKHGKKIYEGDIVNWFDDLGNHNHPFVVEYDDAHFVLTLPGEKYDWYLGEKKELEVIGNIYENPELLQRK